MFVDTHCHIHEASANTKGDEYVREKWAKAGFTDAALLIAEANEAGVHTLVCVGCTLRDSKLAVDLAQAEASCVASIGIHPHEAKDHIDEMTKAAFADLVHQPKVVAIGECGLDYFYEHSPKAEQQEILRFQLQLAVNSGLPLIFHVRDAFDDFWGIFDEYQGLRGVIHSFTANRQVLEQAVSRGLYIGLNGIMTFTKEVEQLEMAKLVPLDRLLLETDAPFLTPTPYRGTICQPKHVRTTAEFLANLRQVETAELAKATTENARQLFKL